MKNLEPERKNDDDGNKGVVLVGAVYIGLLVTLTTWGALLTLRKRLGRGR